MRYIWILVILLTIYGEADNGGTYEKRGKECSISINSLLQLSYRHYPSISAAEKMLFASETQKESAKWNYFPTPSVDISQREGRTGTTFRLDQPLWTGGKLDAISNQADAHGEEAKYTLEETGYILSQKVLNIIHVFIQAKGQLNGFREGKMQLEELKKMLDQRIGAGVSSESDRELLNARISQINADIMMAQSNYEMARTQLELITGKKMDCMISLHNDRRLQQNKPLELMEEEMMHTHPTLKKMDALIAVAKAEKDGANAAVMPNVSLRLEHQKGSIYDDTSTNEDTFAYVAVSFSPGAGLSALSNMDSAKYKVMQAMDEKKVTEQELRDALTMKYASYSSSSSQIESMKNTVASSKHVLESYKRLFIAGKRQWLDLVNASRDLTQTQIALATLKATMTSSAYSLALQTGNIDLDGEKR